MSSSALPSAPPERPQYVEDDPMAARDATADGIYRHQEFYTQTTMHSAAYPSQQQYGSYGGHNTQPIQYNQPGGWQNQGATHAPMPTPAVGPRIDPMTGRPIPEPQLVPRTGKYDWQWMVALTELVKLLDWFIMLLKVLDGRPCSEAYYGWVVYSLVASSYVLALRIFDQVCLLFLSGGWSGQQIWCFVVMTFPISMWFMPCSLITFNLYRKEFPLAVTDERALFAQRPLSTILLGLPFSGVMGALVDDRDFVLHPAMVHIRAMQAIFQCALEMIPNFIIDLLVVVNAEQTIASVLTLAANNEPHTQEFLNANPAVLPALEGKTGIHWFWISFGFSILEVILMCTITVRTINEAEQRKPLPNRVMVKRAIF